MPNETNIDSVPAAAPAAVPVAIKAEKAVAAPAIAAVIMAGAIAIPA